ncbi:hypothetical protein GW17_00061612 [Ensete ventricosum]|nr:hypothetical protein GW17_00061612 [Ensete ventricosum]
MYILTVSLQLRSVRKLLDIGFLWILPGGYSVTGGGLHLEITKRKFQLYKLSWLAKSQRRKTLHPFN